MLTRRRPFSRGLGASALVLVIGCTSKAPEGTPQPEPEPPATPLVFPDEPFRATRPTPAAMAAFQPPQPERFRLDNGLEVVLVERRTIPLVSWYLTFPGGSMTDPPGKEGLASLCLNVSFQSTSTLGRRDREQLLADMGADVNLSAAVGTLSWSGSAPQEHFPTVARMWMDLFLDPSFRQEEFDGTLRTRVNTLPPPSQAPGSVAARVLSRLYWGPEHPFNRQITAASLQRVTLADCRDLFARAIRPMGAKLYVAGAVNRAELTAAFSKLAAMSGAGLMAMPTPPPARVAGRLFFVNAPAAPQSIISMRGTGPARTAPEFYAGELMAGILAGDSTTSRIGRNVREMRGYAYAVGGGFTYSQAGGSFSFTAPVRADATSESLFEVLEEIRKLRESGVTADELESERRGRIAGLPYLFETANLTLTQYDLIDWFGIPGDYFANYARSYQAVTAAAVQAAAVTHLAPEALQVLVVGDGPSVLPKLRTLAAMRPEVMGGEVIVLDGEARPTAAP